MDEENRKQFQELLALITSRLDIQGEQVKELATKLEVGITALEEERKELRASRELLDDIVSEYDRLTERQSTQLKAMIEWSQQLRNSNIQTQ